MYLWIAHCCTRSSHPPSLYRSLHIKCKTIHAAKALKIIIGAVLWISPFVKYQLCLESYWIWRAILLYLKHFVKILCWAYFPTFYPLLNVCWFCLVIFHFFREQNHLFFLRTMATFSYPHSYSNHKFLKGTLHYITRDLWL